MTPPRYLAVDLGAESGRAILGSLDEGRLSLAEIHRFPNEPVAAPDRSGQLGLHWDVRRLYSEVKESIARGVAQGNGGALTVGVDGWGVDFGLIDRQGELIGNPYHYRDSRTDGMLEVAFTRVARAEIFERTGIQFLQFNSLYQLLSMAITDASALGSAERFLMIPDLMNYWLTGIAVGEYTNATTTQCLSQNSGEWDVYLLERMGIPSEMFPEIVRPGTELGPLLPVVAAATGDTFNVVRVIAPATHDTGSAAVAVPLAGANAAWISSGTWSTVGAELDRPVITDRSLTYNFTNEGGVFDSVRLLRNVMGLWLLQQCQQTWARAGARYEHSELMEMAARARPFVAVVDPDDQAFLKPGDMPARIREYCARSGQQTPDDHGTVVRVVLEGLALKYRYVLSQLEELVGARLEPIYIVGGGARNELLNRFTANSTARRVVVGPSEATAVGNIVMQAISQGDLESLEDGRAVIRNSFGAYDVEPTGEDGWDEAYELLSALVGAT